MHMKRSTFNASLQCSPSKVRKNGESPIELVLCINGKREIIQLKKKCDPLKFRQLLASKKDNDIKTYCADIIAKVNEIQTRMTILGEPVTAKRVKDFFRYGATCPSYPLNKMYSDFVSVHSRSASSGAMYKYHKTFERFLEITGHKETDETVDVTVKDIETFKAQIESTLRPYTVQKELKNLKAFFSLAHNDGHVNANPFAHTKIQSANRETVFLTLEEVKKIREVKTVMSHIENVRDLFLFLCFTGLEYADLLALNASDVQKRDGVLFIQKKRVKDGVEYLTFLYEDAKRVWEKYNGHLRVIKLQPFNRYLKEVATLSGITKKLSTLVGRHTFATYLLNEKQMPIESVSKMLGHTNIHQTQHYAKILNSTVFSDNLKHLKEQRVARYEIPYNRNRSQGKDNSTPDLATVQNILSTQCNTGIGQILDASGPLGPIQERSL